MRALLVMAGLAFALAMLVLALRGCDDDPPPASTAAVDQPAADQPEPERQTESGSKATPSPRPSSPGNISAPVDEPESDGGAPGSEPEPAPESPEAALSSAQDLRRSADAKSADGDDQGAFQDASRAYGLVRQFPDHDGCRGLAGDLLRDLEALEERADSGGTAAPDATKRLILK